MEDFAGKSSGRKFEKFARENVQNRLCVRNAKVGLLTWFAMEFLGTVEEIQVWANRAPGVV